MPYYYHPSSLSSRSLLCPNCGYNSYRAITKEKDKKGYALAGATGTNYRSTAKLNVINYRQVMATVYLEKWENAVNIKHTKMAKYNVFNLVDSKNIPNKVEIMDFAWVMKKKPSGGVHQAQQATLWALRGFKQIKGQHYLSNDKLAPVINLTSIKISLAMVVMEDWALKIVTAQGYFLHRYFQ